MGRHDEALADLNRAVDLNPNDASAIAGRYDLKLWIGTLHESATYPPA
jgi:hypothetical protein